MRVGTSRNSSVSRGVDYIFTAEAVPAYYSSLDLLLRAALLSRPCGLSRYGVKALLSPTSHGVTHSLARLLAAATSEGFTVISRYGQTVYPTRNFAGSCYFPSMMDG